MSPDDALDWQTGVWDRMSQLYENEIDTRFSAVVSHCLRRADLRAGESVLDLGTGTGAAALLAAATVGPTGKVTAVDISPEMLAVARGRVESAGLGNVELREGRGEEIPADDGEFDALIASLSLMFVIDRAAAARECARVLRPGGRLVAAVWGGPEATDIVRFQQMAASVAPAPPAPGVGPGALADPTPFLEQLAAAGIDADVSTETVTFDFDNLDHAWDVLAGVTSADLTDDAREQAKQAVQREMWPDPASPKAFENRTLFVVGHRRVASATP